MTINTGWEVTGGAQMSGESQHGGGRVPGLQESPKQRGWGSAFHAKSEVEGRNVLGKSRWH